MRAETPVETSAVATRTGIAARTIARVAPTLGATLGATWGATLGATWGATLGVAMAACLVLLGGCARSEGPATIPIAADQYDVAFDAARATLRDAYFEIERVDAARGVITSRPRPGAGVFTPWTSYQLDAASALEDSVNQQRRRVRITFVPVADEPAYVSALAGSTSGTAAGASIDTSAGNPVDDAASRGPWTAYVEVLTSRVQTAGLRAPSKSVLMTTATIDPVAQARGVGTMYEVPTARDDDLARALAARMRARMGMPTDIDTPSSSRGQNEPAAPAPTVPARSEPIRSEPTRSEPVPPASDGGLVPVPPLPEALPAQRRVPLPAPTDTPTPPKDDGELTPVPPR